MRSYKLGFDKDQIAMVCNRFVSASTNDKTSALFNIQVNKKANRQANTQIDTASATKLARRLVVELPNTFWVLILFIRIGASEVLKFVKLIPAITITSKAINTNNIPYWDETNFIVGAVYEDFPENSQLENGIYARMNKRYEDDWFSQQFMGYLLLDSPEPCFEESSSFPDLPGKRQHLPR